MNTIKYFVKLILKPKAFFQHQSIKGKKIYHQLMKCFFFFEYNTRKKFLNNLSQSNLGEISKDLGYLKLDFANDNSLVKAKTRGQELIKEIDFKKLKETSEKKYLISTQVDILDPKNAALKEFAMNKNLVKLVGDYIGFTPVLENVMMWYSPNENNEGTSSQYYHLDAQDLNTMQVFLYLTDVDEQSGPLTLIKAKWSTEIINQLNYKKNSKFKRIDDEMVFSIAPQDAEVKLLGSAGSAFIADTDTCLHYGSRKGTKERYLIVFQYYTPFAFPLPYKWRTGLPFYKKALSKQNELTEIERFVLGVN
ncbi:hypothetical protein C0V70_01665 [Bacteriovorax stolpii]|uniref:Uncharacterized protein n=1 Tax=Bacteriovorax stolpii TaxID=960 RepID=A0A2K9NMS7_BACTC|nr:hypothetical protein [Bacteriovorax stolpii]AUN96831.1 hypothetical protein C0V70_01665 [Bacteriovorax stolpii]TDP53109.1 hypothetical protein C8D79_1750 [Bacteriovorax stolpii]